MPVPLTTMSSWVGWGTNLCCSSILSRSRRYAERRSQPHMVADERQVVGLLPTCAPGFRSVVGTVLTPEPDRLHQQYSRHKARKGETGTYWPLPVRTFAQTRPLEWWGETVIKANRTKLNYLLTPSYRLYNVFKWFSNAQRFRLEYYMFWKIKQIYLWRSCWSFLQRVEIPWDWLMDSHQEHLNLYYSIEFHCDALFIITVKKCYLQICIIYTVHC